MGHHQPRADLVEEPARRRTRLALLLKRKPVQGTADVELDEKSVEVRMYEYLRHVPQAAKPMKIRVEDGKPNPQDIANTAKERLFVKIKLNA
jgi:hypothetical protein